MMKTITPAELCRLRDDGKAPRIFDVRTPAEYGECHVNDARLVPLDKLEPGVVLAGVGAEDSVYLLCRSGARATKALEKLEAAGCQRAVLVEGGMMAWEAAGLPVVRGQKTMSLERQVRIAAGALVLLGVVLGATVNSLFYGLSGFVGAGLMFAGITDTCAMGMFIAKMPWNQRGGTDFS
jgi:rhodanese-related sulfurtransferase